MSIAPSASFALAVLATTSVVGGCATVSSQPILTGPAAASALGAGSVGPAPGEDVAIGGQQCADSHSAACPGSLGVRSRSFFPGGEDRSSVTTARPALAAGGGIAYFLPRQLAKVTAKHIDLKFADLLADLGKKQKAADAARGARSGLEEAIEATKAAIVEHAENTVVRDLLLAELEAKKKALPGAKEQEEAAATALKSATSALASAPRDGGVAAGRGTALTVELLPMSADPNFGFRATALHSPTRDDTQKLEISPAGLLVSTDFVATDRTGDILVELAGIAGLAYGGRYQRSLESQKGDCGYVPDQVISIVDFADQDQVDKLNADLACMGVRIQKPGDVSRPTELASADQAVRGGLYYRRAIEVPLRIEFCPTECGETGWVLRETKVLPLPQAGPISYVRQDAGLFVRTAYKLGFKDGMLVSYDADRPSELLEIARTPLRMVDAAFSSASKIISLRTGQNDAIAKLSASDLAVLKALARDRATTDDFQKCVAEKQAAGASILPCLPQE